MANKQLLIDGVLAFASTPSGRSAVFCAAVAFAICHLVAWLTDQTADPTDLQPQLIHFGAVLCRFALPAWFMLIGLAGHVTGKVPDGAE